MICCDEHTLKNIHNHVDGVPNVRKVKFNYLTLCVTCLKANLTKYSAGHHSLYDSLMTPYQGLYIDFGFPDCTYKDKEANIIEPSCVDIE